MLQNLRDNMKGVFAYIVVGLLIIGLTMFGVTGIFVNPTSDPVVGEVNGEEITEIQLQRAIAQQKAQLRQRFGENLPASFLEDENLREPAMEYLIERALWRQATQDGDMVISNERIDRMLVEAPEFQRDGKFSPELFRFQANNLGYTANGMREILKEDLVIGLLESSLGSSGFVTEQQMQQIAALSKQARDFYYLTIPVQPLRETVEISDESAMAYYEAHQAEFNSPEQVVLDYIELSLDEIASSVEIPEQQLREEYALEIADFEAAPEYHAAHILVESKEDGSEQSTLAEIKNRLSDGEDFAALAAEFSDDFGSKNSGGDLGFTSGDTFPESFETALAALEVGAVSEPVETEAGFHIIKLLEKRGTDVPSFEEQKSRILNVLQRRQAQDQYLDLRQRLEDMTYSAPDLQEASEILGLPVQTSPAFSRSGGSGIASNPNVVEVAFSDDLLVAGHNSEGLEIGDDHIAVVRVKEHMPQRTLAFEEVKAQIVERLKREDATKLVEEKGRDIIAAAKSGESIEDLAKANGYEWQVSLKTERTSPQVRREVIEKVFSLPRPTEGETMVDGLTNNSGDYVVVHLTKVEDGNYADLSAAEKNSLRQQLQRIEGESAYGAYVANLRERASIDLE